MKDSLCSTPHSSSTNPSAISFTAQGTSLTLGKGGLIIVRTCILLVYLIYRSWSEDYSKLGKAAVSASDQSGAFLHYPSCLSLCLIWAPGTSLVIVKAGHNNTDPLIRTMPEKSQFTPAHVHTHWQLALIIHKNKAWFCIRKNSQGLHANSQNNLSGL